MLIVELLESQIISKAEALDPQVLGGVFRPFFWINVGAAAVVHVNGFLQRHTFQSKRNTTGKKELDFPSCNLPLRISRGAREPRPAFRPFVEEKGWRANRHSLASCVAMRPPVLQPHNRGCHDNREANLLVDRT